MLLPMYAFSKFSSVVDRVCRDMLFRKHLCRSRSDCTLRSDQPAERYSTYEYLAFALEVKLCIARERVSQKDRDN